MPTRTKPCPRAGCPAVIPRTATGCDDHARPTPAARGYDTGHRQLRALVQADLDAGAIIYCTNPHCDRPEQPIDPDAWQLGHTPDRREHRGPEHTRCNEVEGARLRR